MNFKRSKQDNEIKIDLTAMVDVVFLLIIFFLVTTTFQRDRAIEINMTKSEGEKRKETPKEVSITLDSKGELYIDGFKVTASEFSNRVKNFDKNSSIIIKADESSAYRDIMKIMDTLYQNEIFQMNFITE
ncbi:biopolymer transporter ExbD [bacterium]|nr:biopolymer transporter ExbD [bacterium]